VWWYGEVETTKNNDGWWWLQYCIFISNIYISYNNQHYFIAAGCFTTTTQPGYLVPGTWYFTAVVCWWLTHYFLWLMYVCPTLLVVDIEVMLYLFHVVNCGWKQCTRSMTTPCCAINLVENENTPVLQKYFLGTYKQVAQWGGAPDEFYTGAWWLYFYC